jgi:hypothetical protein
MNKQIKRGLAAVGAVALSGAAMADVPAGVTTAITGASTDGIAIVTGLAAAGAAVFLIAKVLRKFGVML